jgi:hypothetical protein
MTLYTPETRKLVDQANAAKRQERKADREARRVMKPDQSATTGHNGLRQRDPRELDHDYIVWLHTQPCTACVALNLAQKTRTEAAHPKFGIGGRRREFGLGERSHDRYAVPLCSGHHRLLKSAEHNRGQRRFWDELGIDVEQHAAALHATHQAESRRPQRSRPQQGEV